MNRVVLDASAVLAMLLNEPGGERVISLLDGQGVGANIRLAISAVNWCEILTRMDREGVRIPGERLTAVLSGVELVPFDRVQADTAAAFARVSKALSLGDRACLGLASASQASAWTCERLWAQLPLDVPVELIRA